MDVRVYIILLLVLTQRKWIHSVTVSRSVSEDVNFIHEMFPVPSSMRAIIQVDVYYPVDAYYKSQDSWFSPIMGLYTTQVHITIWRQCTRIQYGQLLNFNLHPSISLDRQASRPLKCLNDNSTSIHCTGDITIQDFKPRHFSFSFGFKCGCRCRSCSLRGLVYDLRIYGQTNETICAYLDSTHLCHPFKRHGVFPNLLGYTKFKDYSFTYQKGYSSTCYQHDFLFLCHLYLPICNFTRIIPPCREMCHDYLNACRHLVGYEYDCDYLPRKIGNIPCFHRFIGCNAPPSVENAVVVRRDDTAEFSCSEGFTLVGYTNITCMLSGKWSRPPHCVPASLEEETPKLLVPLLSVFVLVILIVIITLICRIKLKAKRTQPVNRDQMQADIEPKEMNEVLKDFQRKEDPGASVVHLQRNREFDAFVLYHFDTDDDFVVDHLLPELEETRGFKLFIHSRNFTPGRGIKDNIEEAIFSSNSAVIIMSQGFVDSMWCKEEFTHCYIENMKDAAFNLFVIMMQPAETLVNITLYMKTFFANKTYLQVNDPELFTKLARHLDNARLPKHIDVDNIAIEKKPKQH